MELAPAMSDGKPYRCHHGDYNEQAPLVFADTLTGYLQECIDKTGIVSKDLLTFSNKDAYARIRQFLNYLAEKGIIEWIFPGLFHTIRGGGASYDIYAR